jgi:hypothetical protein
MNDFGETLKARALFDINDTRNYFMMDKFSQENVYCLLK